MIRRDEFSALLALLIDSGAVPGERVATMCAILAERFLTAQERESDLMLHGGELAERAASLHEIAGEIR